MKLTVLGSTGRTGVPLVDGALERGHRVTCLVRDPKKAQDLLPAARAHLLLEQGDATDPEAIERVVAGAEAVIDVTGPVKGGPKDLRGQVARHVLDSMQRHGVKRLIFLTGAGVRVEGDEPKLADRTIRGVMSLLQGEILEDGQTAVAAVTSSPVDWTVVRVPRLTEAEPRGEIRTASHVGGGTGTTLGRGDLATFLLDELETGTWSGQAPVVSW